MNNILILAMPDSFESLTLPTVPLTASRPIWKAFSMLKAVVPPLGDQNRNPHLPRTEEHKNRKRILNQIVVSIYSGRRFFVKIAKNHRVLLRFGMVCEVINFGNMHGQMM